MECVVQEQLLDNVNRCVNGPPHSCTKRGHVDAVSKSVQIDAEWEVDVCQREARRWRASGVIM